MNFLNIILFVLFSIILIEITECAKPKTHRKKYDPRKKMSIGSRIVKGTIVKEKALPHQAALLLTNSASGDSFVCGGSIIDAKWILTAAHCVEGIDHVSVRVGSLKFSSGGQVVNSTVFVTHEQYNNPAESLINDIALINLTDTPITLNKNTVKTIKLEAKDKSCIMASKLTVSGFGKTSDTSTTSEVLMQTNLIEKSTYDCVTEFGIESVPATAICAKGKDGQDSCQGDSGGPLVADKALAGIVSFGGESCEEGMVGVYTRVGAYHDWLRIKTGINFNSK